MKKILQTTTRVGAVCIALMLAFTAGTTLIPSGQAHAFQVLSPPRTFETGTIWFKTERAPELASGIVELGSGFFQTASPPSLPVYQGGSFSWTPTNVYLTLVGGAITTVEVLTPGGAPITDTQGIVTLAFAFLLTIDDTTGLVTDAALNGAAYVYTLDKVYLVLVGGGLTTVEVTSPTGGSLPGVKGISVVVGAVQDDVNTPAVEAITQGATLLYTDSNVYLHLVGGGFVTVEVLDPASAPISKTLGIARMNGFVPEPGSGGAQGGAFVWTSGKVYLVLIGGGLVTTEVTAPGGGSISGAWGVVKLDAAFSFTPSGTVLQGAAQIVTATKLFLTVFGGGLITSELTAPGGGSITTDVRVPSSTSDIRQASELYGKSGQRGPSRRQSGTILGLDQMSGGGGT